ncbi:MAG: hypothetical protein ACTSU8_02605 [Alphaproteobacteria bacterium]
MKPLLLAWIVLLVGAAAAATFLWSYEAPVLEAKEGERLIITEVDKAPVLSTGTMEFDASQPQTEDEDCPSSC